MKDALDTLFTRNEIEQRIDELAQRLSEDYSDVEELCLIGVLKGAFIFLADLSRRLSVRHRIDFVALASYGDSASAGDVRLIMDLRSSIEGRHVLVVDDILDTGETLRHLLGLLEARQPASLRTCVLVRKTKPRPAEMQADYVGFDIPDAWVVGYGLDYADRYRTLPHIAVLTPGESTQDG